ncbi:MAG: hypothetical protein ABI563_01120 [Specibacter sp.]
MTDVESTPFKSIRLKLILRKGAWLLAIAAVLQIVFFGLLVAGQAVPDKVIADQLAVDIHYGTYGPDRLPDRMGSSSDTFTECIVAATGLGHDGENLFIRAAYMPRLGSCAGGAAPILKLAAGEQLPSNQVASYSKYWAGYTIITRPAIALFGLTGMRIIAGAMLLCSVLAAVAVLGRRTTKWAAAGLLIPLALASNLMSTPSTSFSQAISISFIFLGVAIAAWGARKSMAWTIFAVGLSAALFCYVDLLTTPGIPWAWTTAAAAGVVYAKTRQMKPTLVVGIVAAAVWILAFAGTWVSRWVFAAMFLGIRSTYATMVSNIEFRTAGSHENVEHVLFAPTLANWEYWFGHISTAGFVLAGSGIAILVALVIAWRRHGARSVVMWPILGLPALVVPIWWEALSNHSQIHMFFSNRGVPALLGVLLFAAFLLASLPESTPKPLAGPAGRRAREPESPTLPRHVSERTEDAVSPAAVND